MSFGNWQVSLAIMVTYVIAVILIGMFAPTKKAEGTELSESEDWGTGGRSTKALVAFFLIGAGDVSAYTFLGGPGFAFTDGSPSLYVPFYLAVIPFMYYFIGGRANTLATNYGYHTQAHAFGARYESKLIRVFTGLVGTVTLFLYAIVQIKGCGFIINMVSGGRISLSVAEVAITVVMFIYIFRGGLKSVGWISVLQGILMMASCFGLCAVISYNATGSLWPGELMNQVLDFSPEHFEMGTWTPMYWSTVMFVAVLNFWPTPWLWLTSIKNGDELRKTTSVQPLFYMMALPMIVVGFGAIMLADGYDGAADSVALYMANISLPPILLGVLGAAVLAASQSSAAPGLQYIAFSWAQDIYKPLANPSEEKLNKFQKWSIPFIFTIALLLAITDPSQMVQLMVIAYAFIGQVIPIILGLFFWPRSNKYGAFAGFFAGSIIVVLFTWVWPDPLGIGSGMWGLVINSILHVIISLATPPEKEETLKKFFPSHVMERLYK